MHFWKEKYTQYYTVGVRKLLKRQLFDKNLFWYKNKEDLAYTSLNVEFVKASLACIKQKSDGNMMVIVNIRKYKDVIIWGSKEIDKPLPPAFYDAMDKYMNR